MFDTYAARIYSVPSVIDALADYLDAGFTVQGLGIWKGEREHAAMLEVVADDAELTRIISRATQLANVANEDSILATVQPINAAIITATGERLPVVGSIVETIH